jgi:hypothetical protein
MFSVFQRNEEMHDMRERERENNLARCRRKRRRLGRRRDIHRVKGHLELVCALCLMAGIVFRQDFLP